jgi:hypothetical protein
MYTRNAVSAMSVEQVNKLENDAVTMGMSAPEVGEIVSKYGPDVLSVMVEALKGGFSVGFVLELFRLFGPIFLDFAISLFTEKKKMGMVEGDEEKVLNDLLKGSPVQGLPEELVKTLFTKLLPYVIKKYGPDMMAAVIDAITRLTEDDKKSGE